MSDAAAELEVVQTVHDALEPLNDAARKRVLTYITSLMGIDAQSVAGRAPTKDKDSDVETGNDGAEETTTELPEFHEFAELYAAANPKNNGEKALVAGYWLQACKGTETFTGAVANKELTNLGHKVSNITDAIDSMKGQKPQLILQIKKSGTSRQARKLYKISHEGIKRVGEMVGG
jgi:hypothetical protein